jgi:hypothetical protein
MELFRRISGVIMVIWEITMELRVGADDEFIKRLKARVGYRNTTDLIRDALTLLDWASEESQRGRLILAGDANGGNLVRLALRNLDELRAKANS